MSCQGHPAACVTTGEAGHHVINWCRSNLLLCIILYAELIMSGKFLGSPKAWEMDQKGLRGSWMSASACVLHLPLIMCTGILESPRKVQEVFERVPGRFLEVRG